MVTVLPCAIAPPAEVTKETSAVTFIPETRRPTMMSDGRVTLPPTGPDGTGWLEEGSDEVENSTSPPLVASPI